MQTRQALPSFTSSPPGAMHEPLAASDTRDFASSCLAVLTICRGCWFDFEHRQSGRSPKFNPAALCRCGTFNQHRLLISRQWSICTCHFIFRCALISSSSSFGISTCIRSLSLTSKLRGSLIHIISNHTECRADVASGPLVLNVHVPIRHSFRFELYEQETSNIASLFDCHETEYRTHFAARTI